MSKEKAVATTQSTGVAVYDEAAMAEWGGNQLSSKDIVIPSVILLQALSPQVSEKKGVAGDFINTVTGENFGPKLENVVPFHMEKTWTVEKFNGKKWEWDRTEKMTPENESAPYEFQEENAKFRRKYTYRFYLLFGNEVLPLTLKLKGASKKTGSNLSTEMYVKNAMMKLPPAAKMFNLRSEIEKNDEGDSYFVVKFNEAGRTPYEKVMEALNWFKTVRNDKSVVVVDEDKDF